MTLKAYIAQKAEKAAETLPYSDSEDWKAQATACVKHALEEACKKQCGCCSGGCSTEHPPSPCAKEVAGCTAEHIAELKTSGPCWPNWISPSSLALP